MIHHHYFNLNICKTQERVKYANEHANMQMSGLIKNIFLSIVVTKINLNKTLKCIQTCLENDVDI